MTDIDEKPWHPHLTVATIVERDGEFLMVEEIADGQRVFNQPAGHVERDETLMEAAIRETLEETGWKVEPTSIVGFYLYQSPANGVTYFRVCFAASAIQAIDHAVLDEGIIGPRWMTLDQLRSSGVPLRSHLVTECIEDYLSGQRISLSTLSHSLTNQSGSAT